VLPLPVTFLLVLAIIGGLVFRGMSPEDRARYLGLATTAFKELKTAANRPRPEYESFRHTLRARTRYPIATIAIVSLEAAIIGSMVFGGAAASDSSALLQWGASVGPRTTNGEWWRLVTSSFIFTGLLQFIISAGVVWQLGTVLERLVGRVALVAVYLSAGIFAGLVNLSSYPVAVSVGAPGAVFGLYGLLIAVLGWQMFRAFLAPERDLPDADLEDAPAPPIRIPFIAVKRIGICSVLFFAYSLFAGFARSTEFAGLLVGLVCGLVLARCASDCHPSARLVGGVVAAALIAAAACAFPLRNIADIQPEIARVIAIEETTAAKFQSASDGFKKGRLNAEALARMAERTIVPELQEVDARLVALQNVPAEHQPIVAEAREYLRLRAESWRVRAEAIRRMNTELRKRPEQGGDPTWRLQAEARYRSNLAAMGRAEGAERTALEAFHKIKPPAQSL
jgi:membrane associated rhomboid family serine protease